MGNGFRHGTGCLSFKGDIACFQILNDLLLCPATDTRCFVAGDVKRLPAANLGAGQETFLAFVIGFFLHAPSAGGVARAAVCGALHQISATVPLWAAV
ncbi:hypothetical protein D3C71_1664620 [compost metagenome]